MLRPHFRCTHTVSPSIFIKGNGPSQDIFMVLNTGSGDPSVSLRRSFDCCFALGSLPCLIPNAPLSFAAPLAYSSFAASRSAERSTWFGAGTVPAGRGVPRTLTASHIGLQGQLRYLPKIFPIDENMYRRSKPCLNLRYACFSEA